MHLHLKPCALHAHLHAQRSHAPSHPHPHVHSHAAPSHRTRSTRAPACNIRRARGRVSPAHPRIRKPSSCVLSRQVHRHAGGVGAQDGLWACSAAVQGVGGRAQAGRVFLLLVPLLLAAFRCCCCLPQMRPVLGPSANTAWTHPVHSHPRVQEDFDSRLAQLTPHLARSLRSWIAAGSIGTSGVQAQDAGAQDKCMQAHMHRTHAGTRHTHHLPTQDGGQHHDA